jgi:hypothetical protein
MIDTLEKLISDSSIAVEKLNADFGVTNRRLANRVSSFQAGLVTPGVSSVDGLTGSVVLTSIYAPIVHNHDTVYSPKTHGVTDGYMPAANGTQAWQNTVLRRDDATSVTVTLDNKVKFRDANIFINSPSVGNLDISAFAPTGSSTISYKAGAAADVNNAGRVGFHDFYVGTGDCGGTLMHAMSIYGGDNSSSYATVFIKNLLRINIVPGKILKTTTDSYVTGAVAGTDYEAPISQGASNQVYTYNKTWQRITSDWLTEGSSNLFFTTSRAAAAARAALSANGPVTYNSSTGAFGWDSSSISIGVLSAGKFTVSRSTDNDLATFENTTANDYSGGTPSGTITLSSKTVDGYQNAPVRLGWGTKNSSGNYKPRFCIDMNVNTSATWSNSLEVTWDSFGSPLVGIGKSPSYALDVNGDIRSNILRFAASSLSYISATSNALRFYYDVQLYNNLTFTDGSWNREGYIIGSSNKLSISSNTTSGGVLLQPDGGNVRIGLTDVTGNWKFRVQSGSVQAYIGEVNGYGMHINTYNADSGKYALQLYGGSGGNTHLFSVNCDGKVGIGAVMTAPSYTLDVNGVIHSNSTIFGENVYAYNSATRGTYFGCFKGAGNLPGASYLNENFPVLKTDYGAMYFSVNGDYTGALSSNGTNKQFGLRNASTETVCLSSAGDSWFSGGNLAIGHTSPSVKLDVRGSGNDAYAFFGTNDSGNYAGYIYMSCTNTINAGYNINSSADLWFNYRGYSNGSTQFRRTIIGDGKTDTIAVFDGNGKTSTFKGPLTAAGSVSFGTSMVFCTDTYTVGANDLTIKCNPTSGSTVITLPNAADFPNRILNFVLEAGSGNNVQSQSSSQGVGVFEPGQTSRYYYIISSGWLTATIQSDGTDWHVIARGT